MWNVFPAYDYDGDDDDENSNDGNLDGGNDDFITLLLRRVKARRICQ